MPTVLLRLPQPSPPFVASLFSGKNKLPNAAPTGLAFRHDSDSRFTIKCVRADPSRMFAPAATVEQLRRPRRGGVCSALPLNADTMHRVSAVSAMILMISRGTHIHKSFLVPLLALQAPASIISWIKGEYGNWVAFLALLVRLFYFIPGELDLPFLTMLLVIIAPSQVANLRETKYGAIVSLAIASLLAFQHFSKRENLQRAFDGLSVIATLAVISIVLVPLLFVFYFCSCN